MKLIFIRGLPGTGKTAIAEILKKELPNSESISVDNYKLEAIKNGENFESAKNFAYTETIRKLYEFYLMEKDFCIVDELICEKEFLGKLYSFINKTKSNAYWFRVLRKLNFLLEVERGRKRIIKNTIDDFDRLKRDIKKLKIPNEVFIANDELYLTVDKIKSYLN
jgi:tRNA uridine 5-carbamoylmethylation protein Kti12